MWVALTGWGQQEDVQRTREAGFDSHLVKLAELQRLVELLQSWAEPVAAPAAVWARSPRGGATAHATPLLAP